MLIHFEDLAVERDVSAVRGYLPSFARIDAKEDVFAAVCIESGEVLLATPFQASGLMKERFQG